MSLSFEELCAESHRLFSSDSVCVDAVKHMLSSYKSDRKDWEKFAIFDRKTLRYTRNQIDIGNGKFNFLILCWPEGQGSAIHDHSDSHCFVKVLEGTLTETMYDRPSKDDSCTEMVPRGDPSPYTKDMVTYINDSMGLHRMENKSHTEKTVTLHLYSPPFDTCHTFDDRTGHKQTAAMTFWSQDGKLTGGVNECAQVKK